MQSQSRLALGGQVIAYVSREHQTPSLSWRIRNTFRPTFLFGWLTNWLAYLFSLLTGIPTLTAELALVKVTKTGEKIHYGVVSRRVITDAAAAAIADAFVNTFDLEEFNYHGCGTGVTAESASQTALVAESTTALDPDNTRATGIQSRPAANQYRTVGTLMFDEPAAITEHGIFNQAATGGGTLLDRSVFSAINVDNGDSIQFTYTLTINSGG